MAKKAKKKVVRREWTKNDVRELKSLGKHKIGVKKIAKALKRTPGATGVKAAKLVPQSMRCVGDRDAAERLSAVATSISLPQASPNGSRVMETSVWSVWMLLLEKLR